VRSRFVIAVVAFGAGALLWAVAAVSALGSVAGQSSDPAHTAQIVDAVPAWVGPTKIAGLVVMGLALLAGGAAWLTRKRAR